MTKDELNGEVFSGVCAKADAAARAQSDLAQADTQVKNALLHAIADALDADASTIAAANGQDMQAAAARGMDAGKLDRLRFDEPRIAASAEGVRHVASLPIRSARSSADTRWRTGCGSIRCTCPSALSA